MKFTITNCSKIEDDFTDGGNQVIIGRHGAVAQQKLRPLLKEKQL